LSCLFSANRYYWKEKEEGKKKEAQRHGKRRGIQLRGHAAPPASIGVVVLVGF
jgi:hypothetical protein